MIEAIIMMLIYLCLLAIGIYLIIYVLGVIGIVIPPKIQQLLWVILMLVAVLLVVRAILPGGHLNFGGNHRRGEAIQLTSAQMVAMPTHIPWRLAA